VVIYLSQCQWSGFFDRVCVVIYSVLSEVTGMNVNFHLPESYLTHLYLIG